MKLCEINLFDEHDKLWKQLALKLQQHYESTGWELHYRRIAFMPTPIVLQRGEPPDVEVVSIKRARADLLELTVNGLTKTLYVGAPGDDIDETMKRIINVINKNL